MVYKKHFSDYWDYFLDLTNYRNIVIKNVTIRNDSIIIKCKSPSLGFSLYKCPISDNKKLVPYTWKSKFCNYYGIKHSKEQSLSIKFKFIGGA